MQLHVVTSVYKDEKELPKLFEELGLFNELRAYYRKPPVLIKVFIYMKNDSFKNDDFSIAQKTDSMVVYNIPNYGRCDYAFLHYMAYHYSEHADRTLFIKTHWKTHDINLRDLLGQRLPYDFAFSGTHRKWQLWDRSQEGLIYDFKDEIEPLYLEAGERENHPMLHYNDLYKEIFPTGPRPSIIPHWGHGPCFIVSRRLLLRWPKEMYLGLMEKFHHGPDSPLVQKIIHWQPSFTYEEAMFALAKNYHEIFDRFWKVFFTHQLPPMDNLIIEN